MKFRNYGFTVCCVVWMTEKTLAQDLDPRAYARIPVNTSILGAGFGYSHGGVVTDPTLPVKDLKAAIYTPSVFVGHSFDFLGKTAQVTAALPYSWADVSGSVGDSSGHITRTGLGDMRLRFSVLVFGAPAATPRELASAPRRTILGASLTITAPSGQYFPDKLINLGTSRWSFKPELALSQPVGKQWLIDLYAGLWVFANNNSYFPGSSVRTQEPMGSFQTHVSYNILPGFWAAFDATYYIGGNSSVDGIAKNDRQENSRIGATVVVPVNKQHAIKIAYSKGAIVRFGADFTTVSIGWQSYFFGRTKNVQRKANKIYFRNRNGLSGSSHTIKKSSSFSNS